jgi:geranylgeranyl diphosphate synthase type II
MPASHSALPSADSTACNAGLATSRAGRPPIEIHLSTPTPQSTHSTLASATKSDALPADLIAPLAHFDPFMESFVQGTSLPSNLQTAILYSLLGPGKRVRPLLSWHCFAAIAPEGDPRKALAAAAAVEMVHAFSLIHDDLPGIDNDDLRRGRPTLHRHTNEAMAILAGDSLLTLSFTILVEQYGAQLASVLVKDLAAGTNAMIAGQIYDTLGGFDGGLTPEERLRLIHTNKTGALIRSACRMGANVALDFTQPAPEVRSSALNAITVYAESIGLMFQIVDDLLDVTQSTEHLGKKAGKDVDAGKLTYPGAVGIERSRNEVQRLHTVAVEAIRPMGLGAAPLVHLADYLAIRTK